MTDANARGAAPTGRTGPRGWQGWRPWQRGAAAVLLLIFTGVGICEALGWPFLAAPMQRWVGDTLDRRVRLGPEGTAPPKATIRLLGGIDIRAERIEIGAPAWSRAPHMLLAEGARLRVGYTDLWRASRGASLHIRELRASRLDGEIERLADGRASWQFGRRDTPDDASQARRLPAFGRLQVDAGKLAYRDALIEIDLDATYSLIEGGAVVNPGGAGPAASANASAAAARSAEAPAGLQLLATGRYRKQPLRIGLRTGGVLPLIADDAAAPPLPVTLDARVGGASLAFHGTATDALHLGALKGRFTVQGPSLAAIGDPLQVTLPTTGPFRANGLIAKEGVVWNTLIEGATIGSSRLAGAFTYDPRPSRPVLSGRLTGSKLLLADLGPAIGAPGRGAAQQPDTAAPAQRRAPGHVLPNREFDLPALRAMDANVLINLDQLDLGSNLLEPLTPLRTHLVLAGGVLTLREFDARTGQGRLFGTVQLDGRNAQALWTADLRWSGVRLESWIHQARSGGAPPYATGTLSGQARVTGQGKSTAAILGSLNGGVRMHLANATISHLVIEAAGLDIAQALGVLVQGDDALPVQCSVVDLVAERGLLKPRVLVLDTSDSTLWVEGSVSLANEALDLRVITSPKDFSPLALRTPLRVRGTFAQPAVSVEASGLGVRLGAAALLALVNPLAAVLPLMDVGDSDDIRRGVEACRALAERMAGKSLAAPSAAGRKQRDGAAPPARPGSAARTVR